VNPEQQRIAIAKACGWKLVMDNPLYEPYWEDPKGNMIGVICGMRFPDYCNDLNAMHEAEGELNRGSGYHETGGYGLYLVALDHDVSATAAQRAEAFLKTLNLWKP